MRGSVVRPVTAPRRRLRRAPLGVFPMAIVDGVFLSGLGLACSFEPLVDFRCDSPRSSAPSAARSLLRMISCSSSAVISASAAGADVSPSATVASSSSSSAETLCCCRDRHHSCSLMAASTWSRVPMMASSSLTSGAAALTSPRLVRPLGLRSLDADSPDMRSSPRRGRGAREGEHNHGSQVLPAAVTGTAFGFSRNVRRPGLLVRPDGFTVDRVGYHHDALA